jgi:hypothetical protein
LFFYYWERTNVPFFYFFVGFGEISGSGLLETVSFVRFVTKLSFCSFFYWERTNVAFSVVGFGSGHWIRLALTGFGWAEW